MRTTLALFLLLFCLPMLADDCTEIQSFTANDVQTGEAVTFTWSYGGDAPQRQAITGHDFPAPVVLGPDVRSYSYTPSMPGEKHAQLAAVTSCGAVSTTAKYHVRQCNVVVPVMTVDQTSVEPGSVINAAIELRPGHTARWEVINGTASATSGSAIQVTAGNAGAVTINAWVSRGSSCSVLSTASVEVVDACPILEPPVIHPPIATADNWFYLFLDTIPDGHTVTFAVRGAQIDFEDPQGIYVSTPSSGSFAIDVILSNGTCTRTFTHTFTVEACTAAAVVKPGQMGECGPTTAILELTGHPPFQGTWTDGESFFTWESTLERPIFGGTYGLLWFYDNYCEGTVTGSVTGGSSLPAPEFAIDEIIDGYYWGRDTCPGMVRTARLIGDIPAGATLEWSLPGGEIVSGQGESVVQYVGHVTGRTNLTAIFHDAEGCPSPVTVEPYGRTLGVPEVAVRVEPSTIPAGGTAIVTVDWLTPDFINGMGLTSSLGDTIVPLGTAGQWEYRSSSGGGVATITVYVSNACESREYTTTLTIDGSNPLPATATVQAIGYDCGSWEAYAQLTGVPPFTGTWSNGQTFVSDYPYVYLHPPAGGTYTLVEFADANGPGTITGSATFDFVALPQPVISFDRESACPNSIVTASLAEALPEGGVADWLVWGGELLSGQGTPTIQIQTGSDGWIGASVVVSAPGACSPYAESTSIPVQSYVQQPRFDLYGVYVGGTTQFDVTLDPNTATWSFENSLGDPMEVIGNPRPNVYTIRYTSTHDFGDSSIRIFGTTACGLTFESTRVLTILPPAPTVTLTSTQGETCGAILTATFTGTPPFSGTWWDGQTFTTSEFTITRFIGTWEYVYVYDVSDLYGGQASSYGLFPDLKHPDPITITGPSQVCIGQQVTVTAQLPPGWTILWRVAPNPADLSYGARIVSGETSASVVVEGLLAGPADLNPVLRTPEGCETYQTHYLSVPASCPAP